MTIKYHVLTISFLSSPTGIRVNSINPTFTKTRILERDPIMAAMIPEAESTYAKLHPLGGRCSSGEEQARVAVFLASDQASFVTGQNVKVDGGITVGHLCQS